MWKGITLNKEIYVIVSDEYIFTMGATAGICNLRNGISLFVGVQTICSIDSMCLMRRAYYSRERPVYHMLRNI